MGYLIESIRLRVLNDNAQSCGNAAYAGGLAGQLNDRYTILALSLKCSLVSQRR
jgi:hypothetical protein